MKRILLSASALAGSILFLAQPAMAACTNVGNVYTCAAGNHDALNLVAGVDYTLTNQVGSRITNAGDAAALNIAGNANTLTNHGVIDSPALATAFNAVIDFGATAGNVSTLTNSATGVIGHANMAANTLGIATGGGGSVEIYNSGKIYGGVLMADGSDRLENNGNTAAINGNVLLGAGDDVMAIGGASVISGTIDGQDDIDILVFQGDTGSWDAAKFTNFEAMEKHDGGTSTVTGNWALPNGVTVADGTLVLGAGSTVTAPFDIVADGTLAGTGIAAGTMFNAGIVAPGLTGTPGTLSAVGDYEQDAAGRWDPLESTCRHASLSIL